MLNYQMGPNHQLLQLCTARTACPCIAAIAGLIYNFRTRIFSITFLFKDTKVAARKVDIFKSRIFSFLTSVVYQSHRHSEERP